MNSNHVNDMEVRNQSLKKEGESGNTVSFSVSTVLISKCLCGSCFVVYVLMFVSMCMYVLRF